MRNTIEYFGLLGGGNGNRDPFDGDPLIQKPINALTFLSSQSKLDSFNCPAVVDYLKNVYYITSPFDFSIVRDDHGNFTLLNSRDIKLDINDFLHVGIPDRQRLYDRPMITIFLQYVFINKDDDVIMEVIDPPLYHNGLINMVGEFNISRWVRPANLCCFIDPNIQQLDINRGDPLYAVRFRSKTNNFKLVEIIDEERRLKILKEQKKAVSMKNYLPHIKLQQMYDLFKTRMENLWR